MRKKEKTRERGSSKRSIWSFHDSIKYVFVHSQYGLLHIGALWCSITVREYDENATASTSIRMFIALFFLLENYYEKSRLAVKGEFIEVSRSCCRSILEA